MFHFPKMSISIHIKCGSTNITKHIIGQEPGSVQGTIIIIKRITIHTMITNMSALRHDELE